MEFRKMLMITLYAEQKKRHSLLDSVGEGEGGMFQENSIETLGETDHQPRLDA